MADDVVRDFCPPTKKVKYDVDAGSSHGRPLAFDGAEDAVDEKAVIGATGSGTEEKGKTDNRDEEEEERQIMNGGNIEARCNGSVNRDDGDKEGVTSDDDDDDDDDNASNISGFSGLSGDEWKPTAGPMAWIQRQALLGADPRELLKELLPANAVLPRGLDQLDLWQLLVQLMSEPPKRKKLPQFNTLDDAVQLIKDAKNIIVLTGAGISVSCGIPDFRSRDGIYARLAVDFPDLPDPQSMFDISYFKKDPRPFFKFAKEIYPGQFEPSLGHMFIKELENHGKLLRNFTQNIDTIELTAGIERVIQCHGSFASASCMRCKASYSCEDVRSDIFAQVVPRCRKCADADEGQQQLQSSLRQSPQNKPQQQHQQPLQQPQEQPQHQQQQSEHQQQQSEHHRHQYSPRSLEQSASNFSASDGFLGAPTSPSTSPVATIPPVYPPTTTVPVEAIPETDATPPTEGDATALSVVPSAEQPDVVVANDASSSSSSSSQFPGRFSLPENVIKPDIVFFGESLPELFHQRMAKDKNVCDLLIVVGSSLKVRPVALIPSSVSPQVPQILINRESLRHLDFDIELLGDCDVICNELLVRLGPNWTDHCKRKEELEVVPLDDLLERGLKEEEEEEERIKDDGEKAEVEEEKERKGSDEMRKEDEVLKEQREDRNKGAEERRKEAMERRDPKDERAECDDKRKEDEEEKEERNEEEVALTHVDKCENDGEAHEKGKTDSCSTSEQDLPLQTQPQHQQLQHQQQQEQQRFQQPKITRLSIAKYLQPHQSVFLPPSTHIFSGAEVAYRIKMTSEDEGGGGEGEGGGGGGGGGGDDDEDDDLTSSDDSSSGSDREEEEEDRGRKRNDEEESEKAMDVSEEAEAEERDSAEPTGFAETNAEDGEDARRRSGDGGADAPPAPPVQQKEDK